MSFIDLDLVTYGMRKVLIHFNFKCIEQHLLDVHTYQLLSSLCILILDVPRVLSHLHDGGLSTSMTRIAMMAGVCQTG